MAKKFYKQNNQNDGDKKAIEEKALKRFADLMISRMERMRDTKWKRGWTSGAGYGLPQNIKTGVLHGSNRLILAMDTVMNGYKMPLYLTFNQALDIQCCIKKGSQSIPVVYNIPFYKDKDGNKVDPNDVKNMSDEEFEEAGITCYRKPKYYPEFNVDQTNLEEVNPDLYNKLLQRFKVPETKGIDGMYENAAFDRMIEKQEWLCPIKFDKSLSCPVYRPYFDEIGIPEKAQFHIHEEPEEVYKDGMEFYSSIIHECIHSTGHPSRLNREDRKESDETKTRREKYAHEECIAEFSAAVVGQALGFDVRINKNNLAYVNGWISELKEKPEIIKSMLIDINQASNMFLKEVNKQKLALGEEPIFGQKSLISDDEKEELKHVMLGKRIVNFIVQRVTNEAPDAAFERPQRNLINQYLDAFANADEKKKEAERLWGEAEKKPAVKKAFQEWKDDAKAELMDIVDGLERENNRSIRR